MSRLGKKPIIIPDDVKVNLENNTLKVSGPKGNLEFKVKLDAKIEITDNKVQIISHRKDKFSKSLYGLTRTLLKNMIIGVKDGFSKELELVGVGYRAQLEGTNKLILNEGFSHPIIIEALNGIELKVEKNKIIVLGIDKQKVGQMAAKIRAIKKPEPYKGKGIKYSDEVIKRKAGKVVVKTEEAKE